MPQRTMKAAVPMATIGTKWARFRNCRNLSVASLTLVIRLPRLSFGILCPESVVCGVGGRGRGATLLK